MAKEPNERIHYIPEWAEHYRMKQVDVVRELALAHPGGVDKSTVSRWFSGKLPEQRHLEMLKALFHMEEINELFHHPDEDWLKRLFQGRSAKECARIRQAIELLLEAA